MSTPNWTKTHLAMALAVIVGLAGCSSGGGGSKTYVSGSDSGAGIDAGGGGSGDGGDAGAGDPGAGSPGDGSVGGGNPGDGSGGDGSGGGAPGAGVNTPSPLVTGQVIESTAGLGATVGAVVTSAGQTLSGVNVAGTAPLTRGAGGLVTSVGTAIDSTSDGLANGLGQLGNEPNAVGVTVAGAGTAVGDLGSGVTRLGQGVQGLDEIPLVTQVPLAGGVGNLVGGVLAGSGERVTMLGDTLNAAATTGPLAGATTAAGERVLVPVLSLAEGTTRTVTARTGLDTPLGGTVQTLSEVAGGVGNAVAGNGSSPLGQTVGSVLTGASTTLGTAGGYVRAGGQESARTGPLSGLLPAVGGALVNTGAGLQRGSDNAPVGAAGATVAAAGRTTASLNSLVGANPAANTAVGTPLGGLTAGVGQALTPALTAATGVTQQVGDATRLGAPVNNVLTNVGAGVSNVGMQVGAGQGPITQTLGNTVNSLGQTVGQVGGLLTNGGAAGAPSGQR